MLSTHFWMILAEIINILEPFEFVTNEIKEDQYNSQSNDFKLINNSLKASVSELRTEINTRFICPHQYLGKQSLPSVEHLFQTDDTWIFQQDGALPHAAYSGSD
ncbi:hypothetical protein BpHYR1_014016 [Brachionus plicatilis]|uniref:Uncharacterized protein n=1 Tax=Brachionus plicatilis TaxID=10195 RepID=A0A3M7PQ41_BRAPC|nr:hypothetical protein BpHYR1_014016 [Brachionus plicatilis]